MRSEEQEDEVTSRKKEFLAQLTLLCWASSVCGTSSRRWLRPLPLALELDDWARVIFIVELHNDVHHHPLCNVCHHPSQVKSSQSKTMFSQLWSSQVKSSQSKSVCCGIS
jgi:hypothetical protein